MKSGKTQGRLVVAAAVVLLGMTTAEARPTKEAGAVGGPGRAEVVMAGMAAFLCATLLLRRRAGESG